MKAFKLNSVKAVGILALLLTFGASIAPQVAPKPRAIREVLRMETVDALGNRHFAGVVEHVTKSTDVAFAGKLRAALMLAGSKSNPTGWLAKVENFLTPSEAHALVVNAGETALRDCFGGTGTPSCTPVQNFKFHGVGTGATAAAEADTGCQTELTTAYNPDSTRATGSQTNNGANIYRTVGTNTVDATASITEWCLMSQAATGGGTMWSRVVFAAIALASGDSLQTTYDLTIE